MRYQKGLLDNLGTRRRSRGRGWRCRSGRCTRTRYQCLDFRQPGDLTADGAEAGAKLLDAFLALLAVPPPLVLAVLADRVPYFRLGQLLLCGAPLPVELGPKFRQFAGQSSSW